MHEMSRNATQGTPSELAGQNTLTYQWLENVGKSPHAFGWSATRFLLARPTVGLDRKFQFSRGSTLTSKSSPEAAGSGTGRYAPSTTGLAHPGTLLAALLCWLDARSIGDRVLLRLENLDPERSTSVYQRAMVDDLAWLGLDWDEEYAQSDRQDGYHAALDQLAQAERLYPCSCSRADMRAAGVRAPNGGFRYDNRCRERELPSRAAGGWRASRDPLRIRLPEGSVSPRDLGGLDLCQDPVASFGDPIVRRRDGAIAYHLASVVDDAASGVTRVVRGRDLMSSSATQFLLGGSLGLPPVDYRHHMLLLERHGGKLAKLHGSVAITALRDVYTASELCGVLACAAGLIRNPEPTTPLELAGEFSWARVQGEDRIAAWNGERLEVSAVDESESERSPRESL
jgi:glutamyl-tRNA synthetase/glutamyl-Q tRNA(Asp) synthetase